MDGSIIEGSSLEQAEKPRIVNTMEIITTEDLFFMEGKSRPACLFEVSQSGKIPYDIRKRAGILFPSIPFSAT
jgi:hypothetical protein